MWCFAGIRYSGSHQGALYSAEPNAGTPCRRAQISWLTLLLMFALGSHKIFLTEDHWDSSNAWGVCTPAVECMHHTIPALLLFKLTFLSCLVFQCSFRFHFAFVYTVLVPTVMQITRGFLTQNEVLWKQSMFTLLPYTWIGQYDHHIQEKVANEISDLLLALYYVQCSCKLPVAFKRGKNPRFPHSLG